MLTGMADQPSDELQAAIAAVPDDVQSQLVLADLLMSDGDPRGELIMLDHRERTGGLTDPDGIERLLLLAAEYSFPRAHADEPLLGFFGYGSRPPAYSAAHKHTQYDVRYRGQVLEVLVNAGNNPTLSARLDLAADAWTEQEATTILRLLSDAIRAETPLELLRMPFINDAPPVYDSGPLRGYRLPQRFRERYRLQPDRYGLAPRDYHRWLAIWTRLSNGDSSLPSP